MSPDPVLSPPLCPRCGYDLAGIVHSWTHASPLGGTCSECGLEFSWSDVFLAHRRPLRGFFEHATKPLQRLAWAWHTWYWALWPPLLWRKVGLIYPPQVRAVVLWPLFSVALAWALFPIFDNLSFLVYVTNGFTAWQTVIVNWRKFVIPWSAGFGWYDPFSSTLVWGLPSMPSTTGPALSAAITIPLVLLCLPWTRAAARIKVGHILRAFVYGLAWAALPLVLAVPRLLSQTASLMSVGFTGSRVRLRPLDVIDGWTRHYWYIATLLAFFWIIAWWVAAIRTLFVGRHPGRVLAAVLIPGLLAFVTALFSSWDFIRSIGLR